MTGCSKALAYDLSRGNGDFSFDLQVFAYIGKK